MKNPDIGMKESFMFILGFLFADYEVSIISDEGSGESMSGLGGFLLKLLEGNNISLISVQLGGTKEEGGKKSTQAGVYHLRFRINDRGMPIKYFEITNF